MRDRTPFIGRERERALLVGDLQHGADLTTITGPSGIGKTRLAKQILVELGDTFQAQGGAWFCSVANCHSKEEVEAAVARTLGFPDKHGQLLVRAINNKGKLLLVLDNLDVVARQIGDLLGSWLDHCPQLQLVATSIIPTGIDGEVRFELGPLEAKDAIALYLERAHRAWAGRPLSWAEEPAVEELVGRLDRIPLAIELAAARVRVLPPRALLSRFGERFELLRTGTGRQGSLVEALTLTWELLNEQEQAILAQASVFAGGFTLEAATSILSEEGQATDVLDIIDGLRSKALLQMDESSPPRFQLFESVREFARREIERSGAWAETAERHALFYVERAESYAEEIEGKDSVQAIDWLRGERDNLVAALTNMTETNAPLAARAGNALSAVFQLEGYPHASLPFFELTLKIAKASGDRRLLARSLGNFGMAITPQGRVDEAQAAVMEGLELARLAGDRVEEGNLLVRLTSVLLRRGMIDEATPHLERAMELGREERQPLIEASALLNLAAGANARLRLEEAAEHYERAIALLRHHGHVRREAVALTWVAGVWSNQGRFREARRALHEALSRCIEASNLGVEANAYLNLGGVELSAGLLDDAEKHSLKALSIQREIGNRRGEGIVLANLGTIALERGDLELAERYLVEGTGILSECGDRRIQAAVLPFLAAMEARVGRPDEARRSIAEARTYFEEVGDRRNLLVAELLEGILELAEARKVVSTSTRDAKALVESARARLERACAPGAVQSGGMFEAIRLLEGDLEDWAAGSRELAAQGSGEGLRVGADASWFELPGEERVDLRRRVAIRRMLAALVEKRLLEPGVGLGPHELFDVGWPNTEIHPDAAMRRVYLGVWTLRGLGLTEVLLNRTDGYLLDPAVPLLRQKE